MNEIYNIVSIFVSSGLLLALGLMLMFAATTGNPLLGNYRMARRAMAVAYLFFAAVNAAEYFFGGTVSDVPLLRTITLAVAASQAFLFTLALLALLEVRFPGWGYIAREAVPVLLLIVATGIVYAICSGEIFEALFFALTGLYALLLVRCTMLFVRGYRRFRRRMENYFSGDEADRLRWVAWSFSAALAVGVGALTTTIFMSTAVALAFTVVFDLFYTFFAIRFTGYAVRFHTIEAGMDGGGRSVRRDAAGVLPVAVVETIETRLRSWRDEGEFLRPGITIGDVSAWVGTNDKYLSLYINKYIGRTFREWIGEMRIGEAKRLMTEHPGMTLAEIASRTGFAGKSHFGQQFRAATGSSPAVWRSAQIPPAGRG